MALVLRVLVAGDCSIAEGETRVCDGGSFTIGRGPENDWVVLDPQRHLSKQHCRVELRGQAYHVVDTSTNGVYVGNGGAPLGRGNSQPLNDGDVINLGPCAFKAEIAEEANDAASLTPASLAPLSPAAGGFRAAAFDHADSALDYNLGEAGARAQHATSISQVLAGDRVGELQLTDMLGEHEAEEPGFGGFDPEANAVGFPATSAYFQAPEVKHPVIPMDWQVEGSDGRGELGVLETAVGDGFVEAQAEIQEARAPVARTGGGRGASRPSLGSISGGGGGANVLPINSSVAAAAVAPAPVQAAPQPVRPAAPMPPPAAGCRAAGPGGGAGTCAAGPRADRDRHAGGPGSH
ncbi:MAG: FHA domain-containing protein [Azospirillaceae bacterium]|nr:FHA domain-containing protein [Azospirillaceae bacterium]